MVGEGRRLLGVARRFGAGFAGYGESAWAVRSSRPRCQVPGREGRRFADAVEVVDAQVAEVLDPRGYRRGNEALAAWQRAGRLGTGNCGCAPAAEIGYFGHCGRTRAPALPSTCLRVEAGLLFLADEEGDLAGADFILRDAAGFHRFAVGERCGAGLKLAGAAGGTLHKTVLVLQRVLVRHTGHLGEMQTIYSNVSWPTRGRVPLPPQ